MSNFFTGKVVVITGASAGIGRVTAQLFAAKGAKLVLNGRSVDGLQKSKAVCIAAGAKEADVHLVQGDLTVEETAKRIVDDAIATFGGIDVLVNNAGAAVPESAPYSEQSLDSFDRSMAVNTRSAILLSNTATEALAKSKGAIVNVSSICALPYCMKFALNYAIAKAALDQATVQLAGVLSARGIRVNSVNPGLIRTEFQERIGMDKDAVEKMRAVYAKVPAGRVGEPEDIGKVILFLADRSQSEFMTGQRLVVDGGATLRSSFLSGDVQ